jgi:hypothetical protein
MLTDYRQALRRILSRLDQLNTEADALMAESGDTALLPMAEELRELLVDMRAKVEKKLDGVS